MIAIAGVDGCHGGWICVCRLTPDDIPSLRIFKSFYDLAFDLPEQATIAVDIPIGLPERIIGSGRVAEQAVRPLVSGKAAAVFSVPSRKAVEDGVLFLEGYEQKNRSYKEAYELTKEVARSTSEPKAALSRQSFGILPKIAEVDRWLQSNKETSKQVLESHPEVAFAILNNRKPMAFSKKKPEGMSERRTLLTLKGFDLQFLNQPIPQGAGVDDFLDACVMLLVAERVSLNKAERHPEPPGQDRHGFTIAIHA